MSWDIVLERTTTTKQIGEGSLTDQLKHIRSVVTRNKQLAFKVMRMTRPKATPLEDGGYRYESRMRVRSERHFRSEDIKNQKFDYLLKQVIKGAQSKAWRVVSFGETGAAFATNGDDKPKLVQRPPFTVPELNQEALRTFFKGIFDREAHLRVIHNSIQTYVNTGGVKRRHTLLYGRPSSCKTEMLLALKDWYEQDGVEHVRMLDATSLTKAGLEKWVLERARDGELPEILCFEEIEKHNPDNLLCLLSIMDARGQISRMNARISNYQDVQDAKVIIWATCNDEYALKKLHRGAVWSRFTKQLRCVRPNKELMYKILLREIGEMGGKNEWANKALEFAYEVLKTNDPREIIGLLDGGDRLLDNSYQDDLLLIREAAREEEELEMEYEYKLEQEKLEGLEEF